MSPLLSWWDDNRSLCSFIQARERFESLKRRIQNLGVDPVDDEENPEESLNPVNFRLATLDSTERQEQMPPISKQGQKQDFKREQQEKKVEDFRRPVAVVGISAMYVELLACLFLPGVIINYTKHLI